MAMNFLNGHDSALMGEKPKNQDDWYIIHGIYRAYGIDADPDDGYLYAPSAPDGYVHESKQAGIIAGMAVVIAVILIPTVARLIVKARSRQAILGADDWTIMVAAVLALLYPILVICMCVTAGGGRHTWENTYADYQRFYWYLATCKMVFYVGVGMIKLSITLFVRRLAEGASKKWRITADVFFATLVAFILMSLLWNLLLCSPTRSMWDKWWAGTLATSPTCGNVVINSRVLGVMHSVQGILLLGAPMVILWRVRINLAKKIRLFVIWAAGAITVIFGLLQFSPTQASTDIFWVFTNTVRWTTLDLAMGTLTANLPILDTAIMGAWNTMRTHSGKSRSDHGELSAYAWRHGETTKATTRVTANRDRTDDSDSIENIIPKDSIKMNNILRTDEIHIGHSSARY